MTKPLRMLIPVGFIALACAASHTKESKLRVAFNDDALSLAEADADDRKETSTKWRDDHSNLFVVRQLNRAYGRLPFDREFEGVLRESPVEIEWSIGPNLPIAWKGGVAGIVDGQIILSGGLWMPGRSNETYAFNIEEQMYEPLPSPPVRPQYTQGGCDGRSLFVVGGRGTGRRVFAFARDSAGAWEWQDLPPLPEAEGAGRWLASVAVVPDRWLILLAGTPTGAPSEVGDKPQLTDYRLRLGAPGAAWERITPYPGGPRALVQAAVVGGKVYVFGGSVTDPEMRSIFVELQSKYGIRVPYNGVPNFRDAYRYDADRDHWTPLRRTPFPIIAGSAVPIDDNHILLMGSSDCPTYRVGKSKSNPGIKIKHGESSSLWRGYGDRILCYHIDKDSYSHVGVMPYGVATTPWVFDGRRLYGFGGEPAHGFNANTENVLQIGTLKWCRKERSDQ